MFTLVTIVTDLVIRTIRSERGSGSRCDSDTESRSLNLSSTSSSGVTSQATGPDHCEQYERNTLARTPSGINFSCKPGTLNPKIERFLKETPYKGNILPATVAMPTVSGLRKLWEVQTGVFVIALCHDPCSGTLWARTMSREAKLWRFDLEGNLLAKMSHSGSLNDSGGTICLDTLRNHLVVADYNRLVCMTRDVSSIVREVEIPGVHGGLYGVTYCPEEDIYIVSDTANHCLWFVSAESGAVIQQVGSRGTGECQFHRPQSPFYQPTPGGGVISVSDCYNRCVKDFTPQGKFIRTYGSTSHKEGQLKHSYGLSRDSKGRVIICNFNGWKVVRCEFRDGEQLWEILLTAQDLNGERPWCVTVVEEEDTKLLLVGLAGRSGRLLCYEYH